MDDMGRAKSVVKSVGDCHSFEQEEVGPGIYLRR